MHLPKLPTVFIKGDEERRAFHTVEAKELIAAGWKEKGEVKAAVKPEPKTELKVAVKTEPKPVEKAKETVSKFAKEEEVK